ncbi:MAG: hypothetical protein ACK40M_08595 [Flavobacteriales bacterium]
MRIIILFVLSVFLFSCKKEKLEGQLHPLIGKWKVTHDLSGAYITSDNSLYHEMIFKKSGQIRLIKDDKCIEKGRFINLVLTQENVSTGSNNYSAECKTNSLFGEEDFISEIKLITLFFSNSVFNSSNSDKITITFEGRYGGSGSKIRTYERISY